MALDRLLSLIATQGAEPRLEALSRWTEVPAGTEWEAQPDYGAFVDENGRVVAGTAPTRAFLESSDPSTLELLPSLARSLEGSTVVFLDWGRQDLAWEEIFELWRTWEEQDQIVDCGAVGVPWEPQSRWVSPGWIAFRGDFDGAPLRTTVRSRPEPLSFLARARQLRQNALPEQEMDQDEGELLPMLPFTLDDLNDGRKSWPQGVA